MTAFKSALALAALLVGAASIQTARAAEYQIDASHSDVLFKVKHMGISTVTGSFGEITGSFNVDPKNVAATTGSAVIKVASINTNNVKRDNHLKSDDFFNAEQYPEIKFVSKAVKNVNMADSTADLVGDLTIRDVTKEIVLKVKGAGILAKDPWGNERAAFTARGTVNRFDYNLKWNAALEAGGFVVAPEVELVLAFEGVRPAAAPAAAPAKPAKKK
ncbi:MAG TPA: YceI family protein [Fibrobacteria bacterium]|jgi:polyisoprenoid-binding protein YceI|nr:YceI family protein [Fibrobacteria bacterium]